jgi:hypothetical protein
VAARSSLLALVTSSAKRNAGVCAGVRSELLAAILATGSVSGELLGEPSAELRARMVGSDVRLFTLYQST